MIKGRDLVVDIISIEENVYASINHILEGALVQEFIEILMKQVDGKPS